MDWNVYFVQGAELLFLGIGSYFDLKEQKLPLWFLLSFGLGGIMLNLFFRYQSLEELLAGLFVGAVFLMAAWASRESIGYGDGIGLMVLGCMEGFGRMIPVIFGAFLLSAGFGMWKLVRRRESRESTMPFFPFLLIAWMGALIL